MNAELRAGRASGQTVFDEARRAFEEDAARLVAALVAMEASPQAFELDMRRLVKDLHVTAYVAGRGVALRCTNVTTETVAGAWRVAAPVERAWLARLDDGALVAHHAAGNRSIRFRLSRPRARARAPADAAPTAAARSRR